MALRSLGSTLVAKASPGSVLRQKQEERTQGAVAEQAAGAQPQNVVREQIQQPLEKAVPQGSMKTVSVQPMIQPRNDTSSAMQQKGMEAVGLVPEMGGAARAAETGRPISAPTAFRSPTAQASQGAPQSGGANLATKLANTFGSALSPTQKTEYARSVTAPSAQPTPTPTQVKNTPSAVAYNPIGWLEGTFGGRVGAAEPTKTFDFERNLAQGIANTLGGIIDKGGKFLGNIAPEMNVSENLQNWSNTPNNAGIGQNIQKAVNQVIGWLAPAPSKPAAQSQPKAQPQAQPKAQPKSQPAPKQQNIVQKAVNTVSGWLRSLFGR